MTEKSLLASRSAGSGTAAGAWRTYLELASGLGEVSRQKVTRVLKDLVGKGNATAEQLRGLAADLIAANTANREALVRLIKVEVDRALGRVGLATMDEVNELTARVRELERQLRQARAAQEEADRDEDVLDDQQQDRQRDRDQRDDRVLAVEVSLSPFLNGARDLAHAVIAGRLGQQPLCDDRAVDHGSARAQQRDENAVVGKEVGQLLSFRLIA